MKKTQKILVLFLTICFFTKIVFATNIQASTINTINDTNNTVVESQTPSTEEPRQEQVVESQIPPLENPIEEPVVKTEPVVQQSNNDSNKPKSTNNFLKNITLDEDGLTPEFDKNTDTYYIIVPLTVNYIVVNALPEDENSKVSVTGNTNLTEGENVITITVTSEKGNWRVYKINVTKTNDLILANANLKELQIKGYEIEFDPNKYKYKIEVPETQTSLDITAITENNKAILAIEGNEEFSNGENKVIIRVTAEDGTTQKEYTIYAIKDFSKVLIEKTDNYTKSIITIVCMSLFLICLIILICRVTKK